MGIANAGRSTASEVSSARMNRAWSRRFAASGCVSVLLGCGVLKDPDVLPCAHAEPPPRPPPNTGDPGDLELTFATRTIEVGDSYGEDGTPRYEDIGYDIDGTCTGQGEGSSCIAPPWATADITDGRSGRDNGWARAVFANYHAGQITSTLNAEYATGRTGSLLRLRGYNGEANDDEVEADLFEGTLWPSPSQGPAPQWDGHDQWQIGSLWLVPSDGVPKFSLDRPKYRDDHAYVTNGVLVAKWPFILTGIFFGQKNTSYGIVVTARIERVGEGWALRGGVLSSRVKIADQLLQAPSLRDPENPWCTDDPEYPAYKEFWCAQVDIRAEGDDPAFPCDAISSSTMFEEESAEFSGVAELPALSQCPPETDPATDTCDTVP